ncbi:MAG: hypothetical protein HRU18_26025 [Pseudoalteromonas sp.]|uniref:hypothetical protein n=1 Tax=Pseudoalteromonas sp. TaxID=53249 RepID=UPI001DCC4A39|nr:hypothetical protein [Pseudoalteromonas sp.]NRA81672.1 hypothetical protein [Pseudoalteromonas sp.]
MRKQRITDKMLQSRIDYLNELANTPKQTYINGKAQIGNYHLYGAYGGVNVHKIVNEGGGVTTPICYGVTTKRELLEKLNSYIDGIEFTLRKWNIETLNR